MPTLPENPPPLHASSFPCSPLLFRFRRIVMQHQPPSVYSSLSSGGMMAKARLLSLASLAILLPPLSTHAQVAPKPRARDLGVPFDGVPGPFNAITDIKGLEVGHTTLISGDGPLKVGVGPVRTG